MSNSRDLTQGDVWQKLIYLAGPMMIGIVAAISVSLVDTYFVGKLGTKELAALSFCFPITMAITSLSIGLGAGTGSIVSRAIGGGNRDRARRYTTDSIVLSSLFVIIISIIGYFTIKPLFLLLGAKDETLEYIVRYMQIWYLSMPFLVIPMVANAAIRAAGDTFWPSTMMVSAAFINVVSTPVLIFGWGPVPAYNIEGAAWGTMIARVFTLGFAAWLLIFREELIAWVIPVASKVWASWKEIAHVALPAAFGNAVNPVGIAIVTSFLATFGETTVAAFGVATRVESFSVIPMLAMSAVIGPMVGQNWGAGNIDRVMLALKQCFIASFTWAMLLAIVFAFFAPQITAIFAPESAVQEEASRYLYFVPISVWGYGWSIIAAGAFNAIGKSLTGLGSYVIRVAVLYVPLSFVGSLFAKSEAVFIAIAIANACAGVIIGLASFNLLPKYFDRQQQNQKQDSNQTVDAS